MKISQNFIILLFLLYFISLFFLSLSFFLSHIFLSFPSSDSNEVESRYFVLPLNEIALESSENVYTNLVMQNPLECPTNLTTTVTTALNTNPYDASSSSFVAQNTIMAPHNAHQSAQASSSYTTQSLTTPMKGIIPKLQQEESKGIPIPGRAQSHDDIRMLGTGMGSAYGSPNSNYCISPNSPRGQYMYSYSPSSSGLNASPPMNYGSYSTSGGITVARRALSRAASPLSSSVPSNNFTASSVPKSSSSSNSRYIAVSKNCSRSEQNVFSYAQHIHKHIHKTYSKFETFVLFYCDCYQKINRIF